MRPTATDVVTQRGPCVCAGPLVSHAKTAEPIATRSRLERGQTRVGPRNHVLDKSPHWRNLANTIERSVRGCDAALFFVTFEHLC